MADIEKAPEALRSVFQSIRDYQSPDTQNTEGASSLATVNRCKMEYALGYIHVLKSRYVNKAAALGTAIHAGLEHWAWYNFLSQEPKSDNQLTRRESFISQRTRDFDQIDAAMAVVNCYEKAYGQAEAQDWITLAVEKEFVASVGELDPGGPFAYLDGYKKSAKIDRLAYHIPSGRIYIIDYKTEMGTFSPPWLENWPDSGPYDLNGQAFMYFWIVKTVLAKLGYHGEIGYRIDRIRSHSPHVIDRHVINLAPVALQREPRMIRLAKRKEVETHEMLLQEEPPEQNFFMCRKRYKEGRQFADCEYVQICSSQNENQRLRVIQENFTCNTDKQKLTAIMKKL